MLVYWLVWFSTTILALLCQSGDYPLSQELAMMRVRHSSTTKLLFILASIILIMIAGCRYYVGADFGGYYQYTKYLDLLSSIKSLDEPGIKLVYSIASAIHGSGGFCILAVAAVTIGLQLSTIYKSTDNLAFALPLFVFTCWTSCFNGVRQDLAAAVLFCGLSALRDKKFLRYAIVVVLAFLCHRSSIVMILVYFMANRKANAKNVIILIVASVVVLLSYDRVYSLVNIVMDNDVTGNEDYWSTTVNSLRILTEIAPAAFFMFLYRREEKTPSVSFYLNLLLIHAVVALTTSNSACLARMVMYTTPFAVVAMAELIKRLPKGKRQLYSAVIVGLYWIMQFYECYSSDSLNPFRLKWFW